MPAEMLVHLLKRPHPQIPTQPLVPVWDSESCIRVLQFAPEGREEWRLEVLNKNTISHVYTPSPRFEKRGGGFLCTIVPVLMVLAYRLMPPGTAMTLYALACAQRTPGARLRRAKKPIHFGVPITP